MNMTEVGQICAELLLRKLTKQEDVNNRADSMDAWSVFMIRHNEGRNGTLYLSYSLRKIMQFKVRNFVKTCSETDRKSYNLQIKTAAFAVAGNNFYVKCCIIVMHNHFYNTKLIEGAFS